MKKMVVGWVILIAIAAVPASFGQAFVDVTSAVGLTLVHEFGDTCVPPMGSGSAWADMDNDGDIDLFVTNRGGANWLFRNDGDTTSDGLPDFTDIAGDPGFPVDDPLGPGHGAVFIDYDNDGDQDLYSMAWEGNHLYENQLIPSGSLSFVDVTVTAGIGDAGRAISAAWGDYDNDGWLDVYLAKHRKCGPPDEVQQDHMFKNMGDGTFIDVTDELCPGTAPCDAVMGLGFAPGFVDFDNDGDQDLYLVNDDIMGIYTPNVLWRNDGPDGVGGQLWVDVSAASGTDKSVNGMGLGIGDYDNDGWFDFAFSNQGKNSLLRNLGNGTFSDESVLAGIERNMLPSGELSTTWGTTFLDYDNDGLLDLLYIAGYLGDTSPTFIQPNALFQNNGNLTFTDVSAGSGIDSPGRGRNGSVVDFDQDGWADVLVGNMGQNIELFRNNGAALGDANSFLSVTAEGSISNRDAIGTKLWLTTDDAVTQMRQISSGTTHGSGDFKAAYFGLGSHTEGHLRVLWPGGADQNLGTVAANQQLHLVEPIHAPLTRPTLIWGTKLAGRQEFLTLSDDKYVVLQSQLVGGFQNTMLETVVNARRASISRLDLQVELNVDADDLELIVYGYDYDLLDWVSFGKRAVPQGGDMVNLYFEVPNPDAYVNGTNKRMKIRVRTRGVAAHNAGLDYIQVLTYQN